MLDASRSLDPTLPVILMTAFGSIETAVDAMKRGAEDFITKPVDPELLRLLVARSIERRARRRESLLFEERSLHIPPIIGGSAALKAVQAEARRVADTDAAVLLEGESGTGKELFAHAIHGLSGRAGRAFVAINCAAIPDSLLESELFGHEKGSFTGAGARRLGKFELADGGTVFLDEIGELSAATQGKLLRFLQEKSFHRVGGTALITVDVRIITASNRPLESLVAQKLFREDLFYRVRVFPIRIPPLRDRPEDIDPLIDWFLSRLPGELKKKSVEFVLEDRGARPDAALPVAGQRAGAAKLPGEGDHPLGVGADRGAAPAPLAGAGEPAGVFRRRDPRGGPGARGEIRRAPVARASPGESPRRPNRRRGSPQALPPPPRSQAQGALPRPIIGDSLGRDPASRPCRRGGACPSRPVVPSSNPEAAAWESDDRGRPAAGRA